MRPKDRWLRVCITVLLMTAVLATGNPASADPLTISNCRRHPVCWNDSRLPRLGITSPKDGASVGRAFWVRGWARDNVGIAKIFIRLDGGIWRLASGRSTWAYRFSNVSYGRHTVWVRAVDFRRNRKTKSISITVPRPTVPAERFNDPPIPPLPTGSTFGPPLVASDCSLDVTAALNGWLESIPDNSTILFAPGACYRVETPLVMAARSNLLIDGQGALFRRFDLSPEEWRYPNGNRHWRFDGGRNITVRNLRVQGTNTSDPSCQGVTGAEFVRDGYSCYVRAMEFEHGMAFHGIQGLRVDDVDVSAVWGDGLLFMPCIGTVCGEFRGQPTRNATVTDVEVSLNGRQAIAISGSQNLLFDDARIMSSRRAGFDLEPPPGNVSGVEIRNSYINSHLLAFASAGTGRVDNIYIHHNTIEASGVPVVYVRASDGTRRYNWRIEYNNSLRPRVSPMASMLFANVTDVIVRGNTWPVHDTASRKAVEFRGATGRLMVVDNDFTCALRSYNADTNTTFVYAYLNTLLCVD